MQEPNDNTSHTEGTQALDTKEQHNPMQHEQLLAVNVQTHVQKATCLLLSAARFVYLKYGLQAPCISFCVKRRAWSSPAMALLR